MKNIDWSFVLVILIIVGYLGFTFYVDRTNPKPTPVKCEVGK